MAVSVDLDGVVDKAWADKELAEVLAAPVSALKGVSERDGELLKEAFGIVTVADLAANKYFANASALAAVAKATGA
ncbi:hypothetical protein ACQEU5_08165 [Marinactinospora thermotolerans]|uniref:Uncharacterized protein n=1 Tax=Marinactinospora thermotolerans DSM 45154 TaxID=1122192 RepID=A0A1T4RAJ6_9ACTN|nr:hypothetical protein [Marinactinospora thermotolerans]SKA12708.1 hypothetical protein SAMN02745673_02638 [Marinactinospora thermotolerans DSM 45154]